MHRSEGRFLTTHVGSLPRSPRLLAMLLAKERGAKVDGELDEELPYAEYLIHRTMKSHLVRSRAELVIANILYSTPIEYEYERVCEGTDAPGRLRPDFSFVKPDGDLIL
jgi:hypothetical protein